MKLSVDEGIDLSSPEASPRAAQAVGVSFEALVAHLVERALAVAV